MTDQKELSNIKVEMTAVLKIVKHAKEANFKYAYGQLHGIYKDKTLEISNCYPIPFDDAEESDFDHAMSTKFEEAGLDNNKVGWYRVSYANEHLTGQSVEAQVEYQKTNPYAVYLVYDILDLERGSKLPFKVYRLNPNFFDICTDSKADFNKVKKLNYKFDQIYQQIPVEIITSPLQKAYLFQQKKEIKSKFNESKGNLDLLAYFERNLGFLMDALDDQPKNDGALHSEYYKSSKVDSKEVREKNIEIPPTEFIENFVSRQRINNFLNRINNCGKLQLDNCTVLSGNKK